MHKMIWDLGGVGGLVHTITWEYNAQPNAIIVDATFLILSCSHLRYRLQHKNKNHLLLCVAISLFFSLSETQFITKILG